MAPSVLGAPVGGRLTPAGAQRLGMITFLTGMAGIVTALALTDLAVFVAASVIPGPARASR